MVVRIFLQPNYFQIKTIINCTIIKEKWDKYFPYSLKYMILMNKNQFIHSSLMTYDICQVIACNCQNLKIWFAKISQKKFCTLISYVTNTCSIEIGCDEICQSFIVTFSIYFNGKIELIIFWQATRCRKIGVHEI